MLLAWLSQAGPADFVPDDPWKSSGELLTLTTDLMGTQMCR